jgi:hypothetical protein
VESKPIKGSIVVNGGQNSGNFSVGDHNRQQVHNYVAPEAGPVLHHLDLIGQRLNAYPVANQRAALAAIDELRDDALTPPRHDQMQSTFGKLKTAIGSAVGFAAPLAELTAAIASLLGVKP